MGRLLGREEGRWERESGWAEVWAGADWSGGLPGERKWAAGLGCWVGSFGFLSFSISFPFPSTQNYLNSNEFEFKLLYKQTKQNHAPA